MKKKITHQNIKYDFCKILKVAQYYTFFFDEEHSTTLPLLVCYVQLIGTTHPPTQGTTQRQNATTTATVTWEKQRKKRIKFQVSEAQKQIPGLKFI